jgi:hypothetical protein
MAAPHNRCAVHADAGQSAAIGRPARRAAELRCSGRGGAFRRYCRLRRGAPECYARGPDRSDRPSQDRPKARSDCDVIARPHGACRHPTAVTALAVLRCTAPHSAAPLRCAASAALAASALSCASPFSRALRSHTLGVLPRDCVRRLRPRTESDSAGAPRARWSCTPGTPAAPLSACCPHPRIARIVRAPWIGSRARSRGYRRPCDITRDYAAHLLCVQARHAPSLAHEIPRPRNPSLCHMAASASLRLLRWQRIHALHCWRPARAARVCAPSMACRLDQRAAVARGLLCAAPVRSRPRAAQLAHRGASLPRPLNCV